MEFGPVTYALGFLAGALSTLSPCVLPLLPILVASAAAQHRFGPLALALGLALSFTAVGLFVAGSGAAIGLDASVLRRAGALLLIGFAVLLLWPRAQQRFAQAASRWSAAGDGLLARLRGAGWRGQFALGLGLGVVWSPCVGPTLGAASALAAQGRHLPQIAVVMLCFGFGAAAPLVAVGSVSQRAVQRLQGRLRSAGERGRQLLGAPLLAIGLLIASGWDRAVETWVVEHSPNWLTELTTRF